MVTINVLQGFTYKAVPGQCCGKCEQIQCVYEDRDQSQNITTAEVKGIGCD